MLKEWSYLSILLVELILRHIVNFRKTIGIIYLQFRYKLLVILVEEVSSYR
ncbi:hypothetical protein MTR_1g074100 [Medicago truncatula]|uniref:Uncharacterized protein n=1 Tax=Medicago truncatula TaxID=3880 RepID=A0A072VX93_MEDTR|nr:hypothetical protein MTR_1g074100 [Medicago truncatula]